MAFEDTDEIVVFIHPETGPWSYNPAFDDEAKAQWLKDNAEFWQDPDAPVAVDEDGDEDSYASWTNEVLRTELTARGLDTEGKKADLVARLEADDAEDN